MLTALCVHFSGAGPRPAAGLQTRSHRRFILPAADKQKPSKTASPGLQQQLRSRGDMHAD